MGESVELKALPPPSLPQAGRIVPHGGKVLAEIVLARQTHLSVSVASSRHDSQLCIARLWDSSELPGLKAWCQPQFPVPRGFTYLYETSKCIQSIGGAEELRRKS